MDKHTQNFEVIRTKTFTRHEIESFMFKKGWSIQRQTDDFIIYVHKKTKKEIEIPFEYTPDFKSKIMKDILMKMFLESDKDNFFKRFWKLFFAIGMILWCGVSIVQFGTAQNYLQAIQGGVCALAAYYFYKQNEED